MRQIDIALLHQHLIYEHNSGRIINRTQRGNIPVGKVLGTSTGGGYMTLNVCGVTMYCHRVAFAMHNGFWPEMVDHIDGDVANNKASNLRASNKILNARNAASKNKNKFRGACKRRYGWEVFIRSNGKQIWLGNFKNEVEAAFRYDLASLEHHGEHGRRNFLPLVI
jgi:hypothetical protein